MAKIDLVDISIRDGIQWLWGATGLTLVELLPKLVPGTKSPNPTSRNRF
jgi:hypothetical protein